MLEGCSGIWTAYRSSQVDRVGETVPQPIDGIGVFRQFELLRKAARHDQGRQMLHIVKQQREVVEVGLSEAA
jgi:hypothetical protein